MLIVVLEVVDDRGGDYVELLQLLWFLLLLFVFGFVLLLYSIKEGKTL